MNELCALLVRLNVVGALAVVAVLALRRPTRWAFGPEIAYRLWALPPAACIAAALPARVMAWAPAPASLARVFDGFAPGLLAVWLAGVVAVAALLCRAQVRFLADARAGRAGPAVVGVIAPRIVMPPDDGRYTPQERALVRAHERTHIERHDPRAGACLAALQCLSWFNPLVHLAARLVRLDQELACDAAVVRRRPRERSLYARTLLKTQLATTALPLGCYWPARSVHPLEIRVRLLKSARRGGGLIGGAAVASLVLGGGFAAWAVQPPIPAPFPAGLWVADDARAMSVMLITRSSAGSQRDHLLSKSTQ